MFHWLSSSLIITLRKDGESGIPGIMDLRLYLTIFTAWKNNQFSMRPFGPRWRLTAASWANEFDTPAVHHLCSPSSPVDSEVRQLREAAERSRGEAHEAQAAREEAQQRLQEAHTQLEESNLNLEQLHAQLISQQEDSDRG